MKKVLIVDDEKRFLMSLLDGLRKYSDQFISLSARDGEQAVAILESQEIDLVVTDIKMPKMDGLQLLAYISNNFPETPVIVMTAYPSPTLEEQGRSHGCSQFIEKPVDLESLVSQIQDDLMVGDAGFMRGISLPTFLQLMEMEGKTCSLNISSDGRMGRLSFNNGELLDAMVGKESGLEAALDVITWENASIKISNHCRKKKNNINLPMTHLLMEAHRRLDESKEQANSIDLNWDAFTPTERPDEPGSDEGKGSATKKDSVAEPDGANLVVEQTATWTLYQENIETFKKLSGFEGAGVFSSDGEQGTWIHGTTERNLDKAGVLLVELQKLCLDMLATLAGGSACRVVEMETNQGHVLCMSLNSEEDNTRGYLSLIFNNEGELPLIKRRMEIFKESVVAK